MSPRRAGQPVIRLGPDLALPLDLVTETIGILARKRAGKSYTARKLAEEMLSQALQVVIVDPKGDWYGIRRSADGKSPGFPILIVGGEHGDVPLTPGSGEVLATFVVENRVSVLLDLSDLRKYQVAQFMTGFLETLYRLKARARFRTPMMLMIDEADAIAPQAPQEGEQRMLGACEDIVRRGGQRGIGCAMVSQRAAVLNKNVLTQCQILIVLRTMSPQDLKALDDWVKVHGTPEQRQILMASLASLPVGTAWVWSPGWPTDVGIFQKIAVGQIATLDSGETPKVGAKAPASEAVDEIADTLDEKVLAHLESLLASAIESARANDPVQLRQRIGELERRLAQQPTEVAPSPPAEVRIPVIERAVVLELAQAVESYANVADTLVQQGINLLQMVDQLRRTLSPWRDDIDAHGAAGVIELRSATPAPSESVPPRLTLVEPATAPEPSSKSAGSPVAHLPPQGDRQIVSVKAGARRMVQALADYHPRPLNRAELALLADVARGGTFSDYWRSLVQAGLVTESESGELAITLDGLSFAGADAHGYGRGRKLEEILLIWRPKFKAGARRMLDLLVDRYPRGYTRQELGDRAEVARGGTFSDYLRSLTKNGLARVESGQVFASQMLFQLGGEQ
jgi:hypothetical protein